MKNLKEYYLESIQIVEALKAARFPIDKIHTLIGNRDSVRFRFADGICDLSELRAIVEKNSEKKSATGFKYSNKEGVIKMRTNQPKLADLVIMNYETKLAEYPFGTGDFIMNKELIKEIPDIAKRKTLLDNFFNSRCTGANNYNNYKLIEQCVKERSL